MPKTLHNRSRYALSIAIVAAVSGVTSSAGAIEPPRGPMPQSLVEIPPEDSVTVTDEQWAKIQKNPVVQRWLAPRPNVQAMLIATDAAEKAPPRRETAPGPVDLTTLSPTEAAEIIGLIDNADELRELLELDNRKSVKTAIRARLRVVEA